MKDIIIIDSTLPLALNNSLYYLNENLHGEKTPLEIIIDKIQRIILKTEDEFDKIIFLPQDESPQVIKIKEACEKNNIRFRAIKTPVRNNADLYNNIKQFIKEENIGNVVLFYLDSPLIDLRIISRLYEMHKKNLSEYTFGDNFAEGLAPEVMSREFINKITEFPYKKPDILSRRVFDCLNADINKFFIELEIAEQDFSLMRIELTASSKRNFELIKKLLVHSKTNDEYMSFYNTIRENPEILFIFPKYIEMEITNDCNLSCLYCAREKMTRKTESMDYGLYKKMIDELSENFNDCVISFSLMGEPLMHPEILKFTDYALNQNKILTLIIETNAILLNKELIRELSSYPAEKLILLFNLESVNPATYNKLKKQKTDETLEKVKNNIIEFIDYNERNKFRTFIQIPKIKDNNLEIEDFYNFWQSKGVNVVIQKYNSYLNSLEDRSVVDLTPLDRLPCWHIQKDMVILSNGDVPVCKQDFNGKMILGNLKKQSIAEIWDAQKKYFLMNYKEEFDKMKICKDCDEWYTFNF